mmetsp:Transcript_39483/g.106802  ORF Transcript_39483/g.106802 Transcript_39483/m.106802 type:complete len:206 (+) Transcript_39483:643-1260(+)
MSLAPTNATMSSEALPPFANAVSESLSLRASRNPSTSSLLPWCRANSWKACDRTPVRKTSCLPPVICISTSEPMCSMAKVAIARAVVSAALESTKAGRSPMPLDPRRSCGSAARATLWATVSLPQASLPLLLKLETTVPSSSTKDTRMEPTFSPLSPDVSSACSQPPPAGSRTPATTDAFFWSTKRKPPSSVRWIWYSDGRSALP